MLQKCTAYCLLGLLMSGSKDICFNAVIYWPFLYHIRKNEGVNTLTLGVLRVEIPINLPSWPMISHRRGELRRLTDTAWKRLSVKH